MNCYNSSKYLRQSIDSVLVQTYQNWEIIFWDNQSTDESADIFKSYNDKRLHYFLAPKHTELGEARNLAVSSANGEWLGFLDCDDVWLPNKLEDQINIYNSESLDLGIVYGQCLVINDLNSTQSKWVDNQNKYKNKTVLRILPEGYIFNKLLKFNFIPLLTAIVSKNAFNEVGGLSPHFKQAEDYELFVKIAKIKKVRAVQNVVACYRVHENNMSINNEQKGLEESLEIIDRYNLSYSVRRGLSYHHTDYALQKIKVGNLKEGLNYFIDNGSFFDFLSIIMRKITRILW
ncbi:glycosyltransferase [Candidatus Thioglobus sp.]|nr:glycosyltransferase [Candidatus Thioglobus sp.]